MLKKMMIIISFMIFFAGSSILIGCSIDNIADNPISQSTSTSVHLTSTLPVLENVAETLSPLVMPATTAPAVASSTSDGKSSISGTIAIVGTFRTNSSLILLDENGFLRSVTGMAYGSLSWSPDGQWIAFSGGFPDSRQQPDIFIIRTDGKDLKQLTKNLLWEGEPAWSPNGKQIVYVYRTNSATSDLAWIDINTGETHILTSSKGDEIRPVWSPDGKQIAYLYSEDLLTWEMWIIDIDTKTTKRIIDTPITNSIDWSPDGEWLAFVSPNKSILCGDIYLVKPDGSLQSRLTNPSYGCATRAIWSPDGKYLAYIAEKSKEWGVYIIGVDEKSAFSIIKQDLRIDDIDWSSISVTQ